MSGCSEPQPKVQVAHSAHTPRLTVSTSGQATLLANARSMIAPLADRRAIPLMLMSRPVHSRALTAFRICQPALGVGGAFANPLYGRKGGPLKTVFPRCLRSHRLLAAARRVLQHPAGLLLLVFGWFAASAWMRPLSLPDEGRYVGVAWEMLRSGDW